MDIKVNELDSKTDLFKDLITLPEHFFLQLVEESIFDVCDIEDFIDTEPCGSKSISLMGDPVGIINHIQNDVGYLSVVWRCGGLFKKMRMDYSFEGRLHKQFSEISKKKCIFEKIKTAFENNQDITSVEFRTALMVNSDAVKSNAVDDLYSDDYKDMTPYQETDKTVDFNEFMQSAFEEIKRNLNRSEVFLKNQQTCANLQKQHYKNFKSQLPQIFLI